MKKGLMFFAFALFFVAITASAKKKEERVYIFGASISYSDSIVYFTEIVPVDGIVFESSKILPDRQHYAYELKDYMNFSEGKPGRTSVIYFSKKRSKLEKLEAKIKKKLIHRDNKTVRYLGDKFVFTRP